MNIQTNNSNILIFTSCLNIIPFFYSFYYSLYLKSFLSLSGLIISVNYWRSPIYGYRHLIDIYFSRFSVILYLIDSYYYIGLFDCFLIIITLYICYFLSCYLFYHHNQKWIYYHILLHLYSIYSQLHIISIIINQKYSLFVK